VSRDAVKKVLASGRAEVPEMQHCHRLDPHVQQIRELYLACKGSILACWSIGLTLGFRCRKS